MPGPEVDEDRWAQEGACSWTQEALEEWRAMQARDALQALNRKASSALGIILKVR